MSASILASQLKEQALSHEEQIRRGIYGLLCAVETCNLYTNTNYITHSTFCLIADKYFGRGDLTFKRQEPVRQRPKVRTHKTEQRRSLKEGQPQQVVTIKPLPRKKYQTYKKTPKKRRLESRDKSTTNVLAFRKTNAGIPNPDSSIESDSRHLKAGGKLDIFCRFQEFTNASRSKQGSWSCRLHGNPATLFVFPSHLHLKWKNGKVTAKIDSWKLNHNNFLLGPPAREAEDTYVPFVCVHTQSAVLFLSHLLFL
jgi:hypothetical protein